MPAAKDGFKQCSMCGEVKIVAEFNRTIRNKDGYKNQCRQCCKVMNKKYREENREKEAERQRIYYQQHKDKYAERGRLWRQNNPERTREIARKAYMSNYELHLERSKLWRQNNPERTREISRASRKRNSQRVKESQLAYRRNHPEKRRAKENRRKMRKANIIYAVPANIEEILFDVQNGYCMYCQCELSNGYHVDHILPLVLADLLGKDYPGHVPSNLCLACEHCNESKNGSLLEDWLVWKYPDQMDEILYRVECHIEMMRDYELTDPSE